MYNYDPQRHDILVIVMHLSMSSPATSRAGHIGGNVGICTSSLSNPHPLEGFRINNPQLIDK